MLKYAKEAATRPQLQILNHAVGNSKLSDAEFVACKEVIEATGALARVRRYAAKEVALAHAVLDNAPPEWPAEYVSYLRDMASFAANRRR